MFLILPKELVLRFLDSCMQSLSAPRLGGPTGRISYSRWNAARLPSFAGLRSQAKSGLNYGVEGIDSRQSSVCCQDALKYTKRTCGLQHAPNIRLLDSGTSFPSDLYLCYLSSIHIGLLRRDSVAYSYIYLFSTRLLGAESRSFHR
jgi:hypothetical protein